MTDELVHRIREKILSGDLPTQDCRMTWYGGGTGGICVACELPSRPTISRWSATSQLGVQSASIGGATTSGQRSGPPAK